MFDADTYEGIYEKFFRKLSQPVTLKVNNGTGYTDYQSKAHVSKYTERDLVQNGPIELGDIKLIITAKDIPSAITRMDKGDRITVEGRKYAVIHWDANTASVGGDLIAVHVTVRG